MINNIISEFEGSNVLMVEKDGCIKFELYSLGMAVGYTTKSKGNFYPHKKRINDLINKYNIDIDIIGGNITYLNEDAMYEFLLCSRTEVGIRFKRWVTKELLPEIRKNNFYIDKKNATDKDIEKMQKVIDELKKYKLRLKNSLDYIDLVTGGFKYLSSVLDEIEVDEEFAINFIKKHWLKKNGEVKKDESAILRVRLFNEQLYLSDKGRESIVKAYAIHIDNIKKKKSRLKNQEIY